MNCRWLAILACILITACNSSTEEVAEKPVETKVVETKEATPTADQLVADYKEAFAEFVDKMRNANRDERAAVMESNPTAEYAEKFRTVATENAGTEMEATALSWLAVNSDEEEERVSSLEKLLANFADSPAIKDAISAFGRGKPSQSVEDNLRKLINESPNREVRGAASHQLASYLDRFSSLSGEIDELVKENPRAAKMLGEDGIEYIRNLNVDKAEIENLYESIVSDYADVVLSRFGRETNIGEAAKKSLYEIRYLSEGCIAPDIEGSDLDGKEFALSDYRGKVVMLDFWGDW